jgi:hypothetical protein
VYTARRGVRKQRPVRYSINKEKIYESESLLVTLLCVNSDF